MPTWGSPIGWGLLSETVCPRGFPWRKEINCTFGFAFECVGMS